MTLLNAMNRNTTDLPNEAAKGEPVIEAIGRGVLPSRRVRGHNDAIPLILEGVPINGAAPVVPDKSEGVPESPDDKEGTLARDLYLKAKRSLHLVQGLEGKGVGFSDEEPETAGHFIFVPSDQSFGREYDVKFGEMEEASWPLWKKINDIALWVHPQNPTAQYMTGKYFGALMVRRMVRREMLRRREAGEPPLTIKDLVGPPSERLPIIMD